MDGILGTGSYTDIVPALEAAMGGETPQLFGDIDHTEEDGARVLTTPPYTAYLKIAEGCDNRCAYCVIPSLRGKFRSRTKESILEEARLLAASGVKELIIVAQDITRYGIDLYGKVCLTELLKELCKLDFRWVRLHYLYLELIDDELIDEIASEDKIVKYLHTSVDSGIEVLLLSCEHLYNIVILFFKLVILTLVAVNNSFYKVFEEKSVYAEKLSVTNGSSQQTSHNVSSALV